jgi:molybdopterin-guanine dinucleotide biosynthesis protein A
VTDSDRRLGAIVLAGGRSARFGRDKLAEPVDGRPMLDRAIEAVQAVGSDVEVVVVMAAGDLRSLPPGVRHATDPSPFEGPLVGALTGLEALSADVESVLVVGGDMPSLDPSVLRLLVAELGTASATAAILEGDGRPRPLPMAVHRSEATTTARRLVEDGERRLRALPAALATAVVSAERWRALDPSGGTLRDVDLPTDV